MVSSSSTDRAVLISANAFLSASAESFPICAWLFVFCKRIALAMASRSAAQQVSKPYSYEYFSTLFRIWLEENKQAQSAKRVAGKTSAEGIAVSNPPLPDYTADEDAIAEGF